MTGPVVTGHWLARGDGTPVVALHPLAADGEFWAPMAAELTGRPVYGVNLPGHGEAPLPAEPYGIPELADAVAAHLSTLGAPVDLVGLSIGGTVAQQIAATRPELVRGLVLADTVETYSPQWRAQWRERATRVLEHGLDEYLVPTTNLWLSEEGRTGGPAEYVRRALAAVPRRAYALACLALAEADTSALLPRITAPTLVLTGSADAPLFHDGAARIAAAVPGARSAVVPRAGHASALERPGTFAALVQEHLVALDGRDRG